MKKINYTGSSKVIKKLCEAVNALIDQGGGTTVEVTQILSEGVQIATIDVDGDETTIYAPEGGSGDPSPLFYNASGHLCIDYDLIEER